MSITLEQLSARMRQGEQVPLRHTAQVALTLSIPSILQQIVVTAMEYIDAAMVGHIGAAATASIGIVSSSTWLLHGMLAGLCMAFSIQVAQSCRSGLWRGHQPVSARVAGRRHGTAGKRFGLFCHLVGFPALHHGHGHLRCHAALYG